MVNLGRQNISKLQAAADQFTNKCSQLSTFYHTQCKRTEDALDLPQTPKHISCQYCGSLFNPATYKVHVKPKIKLNKKIKKLLVKENEGRHLGKFQIRLLKMYRESKNKLVLTCLTCHKRTMVPGRGRVVLSKRKHLEAPSKSMVDLSLLSKSSKKKLKRKEKLKQKLSGADSGLDISFTSSSSLSQRTKSASSEDPRSQSSSISRSTLSPTVFKSPYNTSVITQPSPIYTSTPIVGAGNKGPGGQVKKPGLLSGPPPAAVLFGPGLNANDGSRKKKGKKDKKGMLQRMLAAQSKQSDDSNNSSLSAFLSSL